MKYFMKIFTLTLFFSVCAWSQPKIYSSLAESSTLFFVAHTSAFDCKGEFDQWDAQVQIDEKNKPISLSLTIVSRSLNTHLAFRDSHLRSKDYFNVEEYPQIEFKSDKIISLKNNAYKINGELSILGKKVPLSTTIKAVKTNNEQIQASGSFIVNRNNLGLGHQSSLFFVPKTLADVDINFDITLAQDK